MTWCCMMCSYSKCAYLQMPCQKLSFMYCNFLLKPTNSNLYVNSLQRNSGYSEILTTTTCFDGVMFHRARALQLHQCLWQLLAVASAPINSLARDLQPHNSSNNSYLQIWQTMKGLMINRISKSQRFVYTNDCYILISGVGSITSVN